MLPNSNCTSDMDKNLFNVSIPLLCVFVAIKFPDCHAPRVEVVYEPPNAFAVKHIPKSRPIPLSASHVPAVSPGTVTEYVAGVVPTVTVVT